MSMIAQFVQVTPDRLAQLLANPSSLAELFGTTDSFFSGTNRPALQQLAKHRLEKASAMSGEAAQGLAAYLVTLDQASRQMIEQQLGATVDDLEGQKGGEMFMKHMEKSFRPLLNESSSPPPENQGSFLSLEKNWHGVHYLLCGEIGVGDTLLGQAVLGGTELGDDRGYGPPRYFPVDQVAKIAREMSRSDLEAEMKARFDPKIMSRLEIYGGRWSQKAVEGLLHEFRNLRDFYVAAATGGFAVVTCIV